MEEQKEENLWLVKRIIVGKLVTDYVTAAIGIGNLLLGPPPILFHGWKNKKKKIYGWLSG
jgi:hypothetical protein